MSRFVGKFSVIRIDKDKFTKDLQDRAKRLMKEAAIAFLIASTQRIPIRTGFLRGAFSNLEEALKRKGAEGPRNTTPRNKEYYYLSAKRRVLKTREAGRNYSTRSIEKILSNSFPSSTTRIVAFKLGENKADLTFQYSISINYLAINESKWQALAAGRDAFVAVLNNRAKELLPNIRDFIVRENLTV